MTDRPDRDDVLRGVDLRELLEDLGAARGLDVRRGKEYPCPAADHQQTGATPPARVSDTAAGYGLWTCHSCGVGGTAIDALIAAGRVADVAGAFAELTGHLDAAPPRTHPTAARSGAVAPPGGQNGDTEANGGRHPGRAAAPPGPPDGDTLAEVEPHSNGTARAAAAAQSAGPDASAIAAARRELARYLEDCHKRLYEPAGAQVLSWLHSRGLTDAEIRAHRLGADPGCKALQRPKEQLPAPSGPAVTLPLVDERGDVVYAQARPIGHTEGEARKYLNPSRSWIGPSPRVGVISPDEGADRSVLVVCEGICDAILAARHFDARAVIGAGQPDGGVADRLLASAAGRPIVVCFDADASGQQGADRLVALLGERATQGAASIAPPAADINQLLLDAPEEFDETFRCLICVAALRARPDRPPMLRSLMGDLKRAFFDERAGVAHPTGFAVLDAVLAGGLRAGQYMIAAPPALGKTVLAAQLAWHIARSGQRVIYVATEQTPEQLVGRHVCAQAGLNVSHYWRRTREFRSAAAIALEHQPLDTLAIASDEPHNDADQRGSVARLAAILAEAKRQGGPVPVVIVDYLQDLQPGGEQHRRDEREQLSTIARALLRLARRHDVPLFIISSVARDKYDSEQPTIAAFKGSGDIEYTLDAGFVLRLAASDDAEWERLRNGEEDELPLELHIVKNRFGRAGGSQPLELRLHAETGTILDERGEPFGNHPPALPGWAGGIRRDPMPF